MQNCLFSILSNKLHEHKLKKMMKTSNRALMDKTFSTNVFVLVLGSKAL